MSLTFYMKNMNIQTKGYLGGIITYEISPTHAFKQVKLITYLKRICVKRMDKQKAMEP